MKPIEKLPCPIFVKPVTKLDSKSLYFITRTMPELSKIISLHSEILKTQKVIRESNKLEINGLTVEIQEALKSYLTTLFYEYHKLVTEFCDKYPCDDTDNLYYSERQYITYIVSL
jgi:hypothetical protein